MDSGNSCSMQSSSNGGDEELDNSSRGESISSFFNPSPNFGSISAPHQNPTFFDPQNIDYNNNSNDLIWYSKALKPQQNYSNLKNLTASSSLPSSAQEGPFPNPCPSVPLHTSKPLSGSDHVLGVAKKPTKKRTRASRRAPTTVLTTDTTNFRQMVQEFTGIPAAPLSGTSLYSRRLDLFSAAAALRSGAHLDTLGPLYPLRPSAHRLLSPFSSSPPQPPPSLLNSTMIDSTVPTTTTLGGASASNNSNSYTQSSNHLLNLQNQNIPLQLGGNTPMNFGDLSGFQSQENPSAGADNDHIRRWKSGETVKNNDGVEENLLASAFDGNINSRESQHISGYNLNISEKGMENAVSTGDGNVASWICSSD